MNSIEKFNQYPQFFIMEENSLYSKRNLLRYLLFIILYFLSSGKIIANDSLGIKLDKILLFECGKEIPGKSERKYANYFKNEARFINIEFNVINLKYKTSNQEYNLTFVWRYLNGDEVGKSEAILKINTEWQGVYINKGWGWPENGNWALGRYTAQVFVNGELFGEKDFFINLDDEEYLTFPENNQKLEVLESLPKDVNYEIIHQFQIDTSFNSFYKIAFSKNGNEIEFMLSQFSHYKGYNSESTTRNVYLFRNNKQIIPLYFRVDPLFDNDLKNLAYLGLRIKRTEKSSYSNHETYGYFNGKQIFKTIFWPKFYISPDAKKCTYIWNSMPVIKSMFTWSAAYDYLVINNQKTQPEWLSNAKTINITEPVVYIKNADSSFNAVYSAKYKIDGQTHYSLLNQTEKISTDIDGFIGRPYLSQAGKKVAYVVKDGKEWFIMVDNKRVTKGYKEIDDNIKFDASGNSVFYKAKIDGKWYIMKDDTKMSDGLADINAFIVSSDGNLVAFIARESMKWFIMINDKKVSPEFYLINDEIVFSHDGSKVAYVASNGKNMFVMVNDQQISPDFLQYTVYRNLLTEKFRLGISNLTFNNNGDKIAYMLEDSHSEGDLITNNEQSYVMINKIRISPKMYSSSLFSNKEGEFIYAGIDISTKVLQHVKINF